MVVPYLTGDAPPPNLPLGRFLPPIPEGMVRKWCREHLNPHDLVLEPFGFSPWIPVEIARAGYRVLVTVNNPIHAFLLRMIASAPKKEELLAALQDLATAPKGSQRMEPYIRELYRINCTDCGKPVEADSFIWKKEAQEPFACRVTCPHCGAKGEQTITEQTRTSMTPLPATSLHRARALTRIADPSDPLREQVTNAVNCHPGRSLVVLQTIFNKIASLEQTDRRRDLLTALVLTAADQGNTLYNYPSPRERPRQIVIPPIFEENNLWKALEQAVEVWESNQTPIPVSGFEGQVTQEPGISLFKGRLRELPQQWAGNESFAIIAAIPRPNQAFWTFSALWAGWLWGREALSPIRQVLARQRYDWNWHTLALKGLFEVIHTLSPSSVKFWGILAENEPMLLLSTLLAADSSGFRLTAFAQSQDDKIAQCQWALRTQPAPTHQPAAFLKICRQTIKATLNTLNEPASFDRIHAAAISKLAAENTLALDLFQQNENQFTSETQRLVESVFQERQFLVRVGGGTASLETGIWWLIDPQPEALPMIDRIEKMIVKALISKKQVAASTLRDWIFKTFKGITTPENEILLHCLSSYADCIDPAQGLWCLRPNEAPHRRIEDIQNIQTALERISRTLNFEVRGEDPLIWWDIETHSVIASLHIMASAIVSAHIEHKHPTAKHRLIILPGSRANLLAFKKRRNPILKESLARDFSVVKFQLIRDLSVNPLLTRELFFQQIQADPPEYHETQLALF